LSRIICFLTLVLAGCNSLHSDPSLGDLFKRHEPEFEQIRVLFSTDQSVQAISPKYVRTSTKIVEIQNGDFILETGMSREQWTQYMSLFRATGVQQVMKDGDRVSFVVDSGSFSNGDSQKGILYSTASPKPLVVSLDSYKPTPEVLDKQRGFVAYKQLKSNWFLYLAR
jgi:hypothetical protein